MSDGLAAPPPSPTRSPSLGEDTSTKDAGLRQRWQPVMRSPMSALHEKLGAQLTVLDGWQIPRRYQDVQHERDAIHSGLGIADITARGKIDIRGPLNAALSNLPASRGATLARISREWALVLTPAARLSSALDLLTRTAERTAMVTDATSIYAGVALLGPTVDELLIRLVNVDPSTLIEGDCLATQLLRVPAILLRRASAISVVEIYLPSEFGRYAWEALFNVAQPLHPVAVGWDALAAEGWR